MTVSICSRQRMTHACATALLLSVGLVPTISKAQSLETLATGVEYYHQSESRCAYADGVGMLVDAIEGFVRPDKPYQWDVERRKAAKGIPIVINIRKLENKSDHTVISDDQLFCDVMAYPVSNVVELSELIVGPDAKGLEDTKRLRSGHGQVKEAED
ncbi:hypothetical protein LGR54_01725 [Ancylobacter sp. Lp-2]|uniref:hypothetical protein n=1 Tax=Ancylobacter sp. Lp-2 TaxID=2881339 RepID=UPI001E46BB8D|nr:hypothetical protein [Ancylobacter sp. Lp-2]MCB4767311.1 hypothetical protein [Ancylobacter sp. Lp-2]